MPSDQLTEPPSGSILTRNTNHGGHMEIGISLPVRELQDDLAAVRDFAQAAEELGFTNQRVPDLVIRPDNGHHSPC